LWALQDATEPAHGTEGEGSCPLFRALYTTPVVANGVLHVASQHYLWAVQKEAAETAEEIEK